LQGSFLARIPELSKVLEAGCGSTKEASKQCLQLLARLRGCQACLKRSVLHSHKPIPVNSKRLAEFALQFLSRRCSKGVPIRQARKLEDDIPAAQNEIIGFLVAITTKPSESGTRLGAPDP